MVFLLPKNFKLFDYPIFWLWVYLLYVSPGTRGVYLTGDLRFMRIWITQKDIGILLYNITIAVANVPYLPM